jgi:hypothetical protein
MFKYSETDLNRTLIKSESLLNRTLNKVSMQEIFANLTCVNWTPVLQTQKVVPPRFRKSWSQTV